MAVRKDHCQSDSSCHGQQLKWLLDFVGNARHRSSLAKDLCPNPEKFLGTGFALLLLISLKCFIRIKTLISSQ